MLAALALPAASFGVEVGGPPGVAKAAIAPLVDCASLAGRKLANISLISARRVAASASLPGYCEVAASEDGSAHDIKALLPDAWAQRLYQQGGGGFDGALKELLPEVVSAPSAGRAALKSGAIVLGNNGGHRDPSGLALLGNAPAVERHAHTAIGIARDFADALAQAYYGRTPSYAYYQGCSNGGRGALNAAAKYGDKFDAAIAGAPSLSTAGQAAQWARAAALPVIDRATLRAVAAQAVKACDRLDGLADNIIGDWAACNFDPRSELPESVGLGAAAARAIGTLIDGVTLADGSRVYAGFGFGSLAGYAEGYPLLGRGYLGYIVFNDAKWTAADFDLDRDYPAIVRVLEDHYHFSAEPAGLARFLSAGKKIMVWHGSNDVVTSHQDTIRLWRQIVAETGSPADENSRLYIASGVNHCSGGPGADVFDLFTPMMNWVEHGIPPGEIRAAKLDAADGRPQFTRPLCIPPAVPRYQGPGDINEAANFICS